MNPFLVYPYTASTYTLTVMGLSTTIKDEILQKETNKASFQCILMDSNEEITSVKATEIKP